VLGPFWWWCFEQRWLLIDGLRYRVGTLSRVMNLSTGIAFVTTENMKLTSGMPLPATRVSSGCNSVDAPQPRVLRQLAACCVVQIYKD
jgi:hypothetical protein